MRALVGQGLYSPVSAATEWSAFVGPARAWAKDATMRGLLHLHGHAPSGTVAPALDCRNFANPDLLALTNALAGVYPFLSIDAGGATNWGYTAAVPRVGDGFTHLTNDAAHGGWGAKADKIQLHGDSMGALGVLSWAKQNPTKVAAIVLTRPVLDLGDMVTNNRGGFAAEINTVYDGAYSEATHGPTYNPCNYGAALNGLPIRIWNASDDAIADPTAVTTFLGLCASAVATSVGAVGHAGTVAAVNQPDVLSFLAANA